MRPHAGYTRIAVLVRGFGTKSGLAGPNRTLPGRSARDDHEIGELSDASLVAARLLGGHQPTGLSSDRGEAACVTNTMW
jgi:hypothetical protein